LVIATPENVAELLALAEPPVRIWWEGAEMELCLVPGGEFLMGSLEGEGDDNEHPQHTVYVDAFYMGRTPVTQAQYARFVRQADHRVPFREEDRAKPYNWDQARKTFPQGKADHPVVLVSWHDAVAYCRWAGLRLPTEAEWEKAARGTDGRGYPWGDEWDEKRCNTDEGGKGGTTPVGLYSPTGDSPYGCADMPGNVWEWTGSLGDPYPYSAHDGREEADTKGSRVVRGGSWYDYHRGARSAYRVRFNPDTADIYIGFRCCVSSTSSL